MVNGTNHINGGIIFDDGPRKENHPQVVQRNSGKRWLTVGICFSVLMFGLLIIKGLMIEYDQSPILSYESMLKPADRSVYFTPEVARAGETVRLNFDRVYWYSTEYKSELIYNATCFMKVERNGVETIEPRRRDYPPYPISTPQATGSVEPKGRPYTVPEDCLPGNLVYRAFARHERRWPFSPRETKAPEVFLTIVGK